MCSFSAGWKAELPCSGARRARKDYVVLAELRAKIAAAPLKRRTVLLLDFWGLRRREMLQFVIYKTTNFPLKGFFIFGQEEKRKEEKEENVDSREKRGYSLNSAGGKVSFPAGLPPPAALPRLYPALCYLPCLSSSRRWGDVPAEPVGEGRLSARICCCLVMRESRQSNRIERPVGQNLGLQELHFVPAKSGLKSSCLWDDGWEWYQPKECGFQ